MFPDLEYNYIFYPIYSPSYIFCNECSEVFKDTSYKGISNNNKIKIKKCKCKVKNNNKNKIICIMTK